MASNYKYICFFLAPVNMDLKISNVLNCAEFNTSSKRYLKNLQLTLTGPSAVYPYI